MSGRRNVPAVLLGVAVVTLVVSFVGLIGAIMLNAFAFDKYNTYGEVRIPGTASLHLPAGDVNITFHTQSIGTSGGGGLPVPELGVSIDPPSGLPQPQVIESFGSTTSVNNDIRRRIWVVQIPADGTYRITTHGDVSAFIAPRLAFGHGSTLGWLPWVFAAVLLMALVDLVIAVVWMARRRNAEPGDTGAPPAAADRSAQSSFPTDEGIRIEQIKHLAELRDSGALTEKEFTDEKRRVFGDG